jgi:predicted nucleic acid-binding protein
MTTAVDTNVVIALWDKDPTLSLAAQNALDAAFNRGTLVVAAPVLAELIAAPGRSEKFVGSFFEETAKAAHLHQGRCDCSSGVEPART